MIATLLQRKLQRQGCGRTAVLSLLLLLLVTWQSWTTATVADEISSTGSAEDGSTTCLNQDENGSCRSSSSSSSSSMEHTEHIQQCGVYMAPSTLGNATNLGIFTAKPLEAGTIVNYPELVIPLAFREWGIHPAEASGDGELWDRYIWTGNTVGIESYDTYDRTQQKSVFVPGVGCTINSVLDLNNLISTHDSDYDAVVERSHPAAGSFSPYFNSLTTTTRPVPAGAELFADYGKEWIPWIPKIPVLLKDNMDRADAFLKDFDDWTTQMQIKHGMEQVSPQILERLFQLARNFPLESKVFSVLPTSLEEVRLIADMTAAKADSTQEDARVTDADNDIVRSYWDSKYRVSVEWLQEHGKCQDHIKPGPSTIAYAGRGAFATRFLPQGSVVGYAPLIHVAYAFDNFTQVRDGSDPTGEGKHPDLVVNYSFGHPNSTLTLTPYGGMVNYINHAPSADKVNVKVRWPTQELVAHRPTMLQKDVEFLRNSMSKIAVSFDYVALRDIQEGEEIFMDYGPEWQWAWDDHVTNWRVPDDADTYVHSTNYRIKKLKTLAEQRDDPYPTNLVTICTESYRVQGDKYVHVPLLRDWKIYVPCDVLERRGNKYVVKLTTAQGNKAITVYDIPFDKKGIRLVDKAYSQDWHLPHAFRHKIGIPDDVFPDEWKNLVPSSSSDDDEVQD